MPFDTLPVQNTSEWEGNVSPSLKCDLDLSSDSSSSVLQNDSCDKVQIERQQEWNYIRIPFSSIDARKYFRSDDCYWLVLATKASIVDTPLENTQTMVSELLATVSHELKSPLTGIVGLSSVLKNGQIGELNQRQALYTQLIHGSGYKLMAIVNDLLKLQSLIQNKSQIASKPLNLKFLCRQVYQQCLTKINNDKAKDSKIKFVDTQLKLEIDPELDIAIAHQSCLSAILSYLILETIHFADEQHNTIVIRAENITIQPKKLQKTAITVSNERVANSRSNSSGSSSSSFKQSSDLNLVLAKYLGQIISGEIESNYSEDGCKLTLLLPVVASKTIELPKKNPLTVKDQPGRKQNLTILCLYPEVELINPTRKHYDDSDFNLKNWAEQDWSSINQQQSNYQHRIIEADGLEQAHTLARIWKLDVILLDGHQIKDPEQYLRSLQKSTYLAALPLITLDTRTTEAANQIEGLNVYPCLLPAQCRNIQDLIQVIQIATG